MVTLTKNAGNTSPGWFQSRFSPAGLQFFLLFAGFLALRVALFLQFKPADPGSSVDVLKTFLVGLHLDVLTALVMTLPLILWLAILPDQWFRSPLNKVVLRGGMFVFCALEGLVLFAEFCFFKQFHARFNQAAVIYLLHQGDFNLNLAEAYALPRVLGICAFISLVLVVLALPILRAAGDEVTTRRTRFLRLAGAFTLAAFLCTVVTARETRFLRESASGEIANNGLFSLASAAWSHDLAFAPYYPALPLPQAYERVHRILAEPRAVFVAASNSIQRQILGGAARPKLNLVFVLVPNFGSEYWGCLGRKDSLTPRLDQLALKEGLLFTNLYAPDGGSLRGIEAMLASFPPLPGEAIVRRDHSDNLETLARVLKRDGYGTLCLFGGRGNRDDIRSFVVRNGYDRFIGRSEFDHAHTVTFRGVSDEDLYNRGIGELRDLSATGKPFFATFLPISTREPATLGGSEGGNSAKLPPLENAVEYADSALGRFLGMVQKEPFYKNTVFVVVGLPAELEEGRSGIGVRPCAAPVVVVGPAIVKSPALLGVSGGLMDVPPTVLGLIGRPYVSMFFGRDLLDAGVRDRLVPFSHDLDIGMLRGDRLVSFGFNRDVKIYHGEPGRGKMVLVAKPDSIDVEFAKDATAIFEVGDDLYMHDRFHIETISKPKGSGPGDVP